MAEAEVIAPRAVRNTRAALFHSNTLALDLLARFARALALEHRLLGSSGADPRTDEVIRAAETAWADLARAACALAAASADPARRDAERAHAPVVRLAATLALGAASARDTEDAEERFGRLLMASEALFAQVKSAEDPAAPGAMLPALGVLHRLLWQAARLEAGLVTPARAPSLPGAAAQPEPGPALETGMEAGRPVPDPALG